MNPGNIQVRLATEADISCTRRTLLRALADYPHVRHTISADDYLRRVEESHELFLTEIGLRHGQVWVVRDGLGVAVWTTPASTGVAGAFARIATRQAELAGDRLEAASQADVALRPHRPAEPAWFLAMVAVDPAVQGQGLGRAALAPALEAADHNGDLAYLETCDERNLRLYRDLGFTVTAEVTLPLDGPRTWCMRRTSRGDL